jgi:hypothetical protein
LNHPLLKANRSCFTGETVEFSEAPKFLENEMKTSLVLLALSLIPAFASADSFNCNSSAIEHLHVRIQNNTDPALGTRTAAVLLVTDTEAAFGERTRIASNEVRQNGTYWTVDTTAYQSGTPGQAVGEYDKTELSQVQVYIPAFTYNEANKDGSEYPGHLFLFKAGETNDISQDIELGCIYNTKY